MITPETIGDTPESLLPKDKRHDWPLLIVMTIMAFLAGLALLLSAMSIRATNYWQDDLKQTATVQIFTEDNTDRDQVLLSALEILDAQSGGLNAKAVSEEKSRDMLRPWLGDLTLPEDLPLPILISLETGPGQNIENKPSPLKAFLPMSMITHAGPPASTGPRERLRSHPCLSCFLSSPPPWPHLDLRPSPRWSPGAVSSRF